MPALQILRRLLSLFFCFFVFVFFFFTKNSLKFTKKSLKYFLKVLVLWCHFLLLVAAVVAGAGLRGLLARVAAVVAVPGLDLSQLDVVGRGGPVLPRPPGALQPTTLQQKKLILQHITQTKNKIKFEIRFD